MKHNNACIYIWLLSICLAFTASQANAVAQRMEAIGIQKASLSIASTPLAQRGHWLLNNGLSTSTQRNSESRLMLAQAGARSAKEAADIARARSGGGKVLSVSQGQNGGKKIYRVKVLQKSGRVTFVTVQGQ